MLTLIRVHAHRRDEDHDLPAMLVLGPDENYPVCRASPRFGVWSARGCPKATTTKPAVVAVTKLAAKPDGSRRVSAEIAQPGCSPPVHWVVRATEPRIAAESMRQMLMQSHRGSATVVVGRRRFDGEQGGRGQWSEAR